MEILIVLLVAAFLLYLYADRQEKIKRRCWQEDQNRELQQEQAERERQNEIIKQQKLEQEKQTAEKRQQALQEA